MTKQAKTGSVTSKSGKVIVSGKIVTGIDIEGAASDDVLKAALETMQTLNTGDVSGEQGVEAGEIIIGFRYLNPQAPTREAFVAEAQALRETLANLAAMPEAPAEAEAAVEELEGAIAESQKEKPLSQRITSRLRDTIQFITDTSKALEAAQKAGPIIAQALPIAYGLYKAAQALF